MSESPPYPAQTSKSLLTVWRICHIGRWRAIHWWVACGPARHAHKCAPRAWVAPHVGRLRRPPLKSLGSTTPLLKAQIVCNPECIADAHRMRPTLHHALRACPRANWCCPHVRDQGHKQRLQTMHPDRRHFFLGGFEWCSEMLIVV